MKTLWTIYEGYDSYDGDAGISTIFTSKGVAEAAVKTLIRKRAASNKHPWTCEVEEMTLFESYDEWFEEAKSQWGWRTP